MKKLLLLLLILAALLSLSAVSAEENTTDVIAESADNDTVFTDSDEPLIAEDELSDNATQKTASKITSSNVKGYESFKTDISFTLTSNSTPLASKKVFIKVNGKSYEKTTDKSGKATLSLKLKKGTYAAEFYYPGDNLTGNASKTSKLTVKSPTKTKLKLGDKDINYRQGSKTLFYVKLLTKDGKAIKNQWVTFKVSGKSYKAKTNKKGIAKVFLNLKKGTRKVKYSFKKTSPYLSSSGSVKLKVRAKLPKGDGYWLWSAHMKNVNLKSLAGKGTKNILLHVNAISLYGKSAVVSFISKAHKYGMKVHLWMQIAYSGGKWVPLVDEHENIKYSFLNKKIAEAKSYAKIKGVDGIHFDYIRYGGGAHKHPKGVASVSYFAKKASIEIHKIKPNCIVSAAIMPEPKMMHYYYGQDVPTMSKYMDVLIPMVYKGNYHQSRSWVKSVTKTFAKQSNGAKIWTGLQSYYSDNNAKKLPHGELLKDAKAAKKGGASGTMLFRIGISCNFNFKKV